MARGAGVVTYCIDFVDHGGNVYARDRVEHDDEPALIDELHRRHEHGIGAGFDVWDGDRLVHRHRR